MQRKASKSMASNKSDFNPRPFYCAADDDPFPLPDNLAPLADREPVHVHDFTNLPLLNPPSIPSSDLEGQEEATFPRFQIPTADISKYAPRASIVAALQPPPRVTCAKPGPPPELSALLDELPHHPLSNSPAEPLPHREKFTVVTIAVYNSQSPAKSAEFTLSASAPLMTLINQMPCTARPHLIDAPSPAVLYIGNTIYHYTLPRRPDYGKPIQKFLRQNCTTKPPELLPITSTSPTIEQLTLTLGLPYPFLHHADCEHLIIFTDIYQTHQKPPVSEVQHRPPRLNPCDVCSRRAADRFTVGDPLADASPFHYCAECFRLAHYAQDGQLFKRTSGFRVYRQYTPM